MKFTIDKKIGLLLIIMAAIATINLATVYQFLSSQKYNSYIINIAGRQRMLAEKLARFALSVKNGNESEREEILGAIEFYNFSLYKLQNGGEIEGFTITAAPKSMNSIFKKNWEIWLSIKTSIENILNDIQYHNMQFSDALLYINNNSEVFLRQTDKIVKAFANLKNPNDYQIGILKKQKELSQKILKYALSVGNGNDEDREKLKQYIELYDKSVIHNQSVLIPSNLNSVIIEHNKTWVMFKKNLDILANKEQLNKTLDAEAFNVNSKIKDLLDVSNEITSIYGNIFMNKITSLKRLLIIMLALDIIIIIIGWFSANKLIVRPLKYLSKTAINIGRGDLNQKISISHTNDEIGELATSFNTMLMDLQQTTVSKKFVDNIIASMMNSLIVVYPDGTISQVNQSTLNLLGYREDELIGQPFSKILGNWEELNKDSVSIGELLKEGDFQSEEQSYITKDAKKLPVLFANSIMLKEDGSIQGIVCVAQDITDIKAAEMQLKLNEEKFRSITTAANDAIILMDETGIITYCNHAVSKMFGYKTSELIGKDLHTTLAPTKYHGDFKMGFEGFKASGHGNAIGKTTEFTGINNKGIEFPVEISLASFRSDDKLYALGIIRDITERKLLEDELKRLATTDRLTGAFNRLKFDDIIGIETARAKRYNAPISLLMFDIDKFKNVNDRFGHDIGDEVLKVVASKVSANIRKMDYFFRWGGEEFIILVPNTNLDGAAIFAENIRKIIESHTFDVVKSVTISIGVSQYRDDEKVDVFIKRADQALYTAKENGRNRVEVGV